MQHIIYVLTCLVLIGADQFTKHIANIHLKPVGRMDFIPGFLELSYTLNRGAAFGILQGWRWAFLIITAVTMAVLVVFYIRLPRMKQKPHVMALSRIAVAIISAGAIGNAIERA
ncbi:MAG: signal peptidase II, partial [Clostridiales bacterium]|nr:signal peptidase II [Clostridiales bacterium]